MSTANILVIEDDAAIRLGVCDTLELAGYTAQGADSGERGIELLSERAFDLVLLDVVLPGKSGMEVITKIHQLRPHQAVIMLTARGDINDRIQGLKLGADDYVVKPFDAGELLARVQSVLRRAPPTNSTPDSYQLPNQTTVDFQRRVISGCNGIIAQLSDKESELLSYFVARCGQVISRDELIEHVWGLNPQGLNTRTVDMHVARLREKIGDTNNNRQWLTTVRGKGYCFAPEGHS